MDLYLIRGRNTLSYPGIQLLFFFLDCNVWLLKLWKKIFAILFNEAQFWRNSKVELMDIQPNRQM
jgi:hypothetical protein